MSNESKNDIDRLLAAMSKHNASDLHLKAGRKPLMRVTGTPREVGSKILSGEDIENVIRPILTERASTDLENTGSADLAYQVDGVGRFRVNLFRQRGAISAAIRRVAEEIPSISALHLPKNILKLAKLHAGLILISGATGSGKSSTLASMINYINLNRPCHILTVEDPIEYLFTDDKAFISQREINTDVDTFSNALRSAMRQDPDVILCGEMRDAETFEFALSAAETGHLVFGTLHASSSAQTISRLLDLYPANKHNAVRQGLIFNLKGIICQRLLPSIKEDIERIPVIEIMTMNPAIQKLIHDKDDKKIQEIVRKSEKEGMIDFNSSLVKLVNNGFVSTAVALQASDNPEQLKMNLKGIFIGGEGGGAQ